MQFGLSKSATDKIARKTWTDTELVYSDTTHKFIHQKPPKIVLNAPKTSFCS